MGAVMTGNVVTADGTVINGNTYGLNLPPNQLAQLRNAYNSAVTQGQSSSQAFQTAASQVITSTGDPLSTALQLFQTAINLHGGPANANLSTSSIVNGYAQAAITSQSLNNILNPTVSGSATTTSTSRFASASSSGSSTDNLVVYLIGGSLIIGMAFLLFESEPSDKGKKQRKLPLNNDERNYQ